MYFGNLLSTVKEPARLILLGHYLRFFHTWKYSNIGVSEDACPIFIGINHLFLMNSATTSLNLLICQAWRTEIPTLCWDIHLEIRRDILIFNPERFYILCSITSRELLETSQHPEMWSYSRPKRSLRLLIETSVSLFKSQRYSFLKFLSWLISETLLSVIF